MEDIYLTKVVRVGSSKGIIIPTNILNALNWQRGDTIIFILANPEQLIIKRVSDKDIHELKHGRIIEGEDGGPLPTIRI